MGEPANETQRTLWIGDLGYWMDENFLYNLFAGTGTVTSVKIIRSKATNVSEGYGFIEFNSHDAASQILSTYNGCPIPGTDQIFRLNWAAFGVGKGSTEAADHSVFVGDLAPDVTDYVLQEHFRQYFPSVRSAKVITDPLTSRSKGYGFVRFGSEAERDRALGEMSGHFISNRPIRVSLATAKKSASLQPGAGGLGGGSSSALQGALGDLDPSNTTLFIGGLSAAVTEDQLRAIFHRFGEIVYVKIPAGKGCGFVQFMGRANAEAAMLAMNGQMVGSTSIRISWGRSSANRHAPSLGVVAPQSAFPPAVGGGYGYSAAYSDPSGAYGASPYATAPGDPYGAFYAQHVAPPVDHYAAAMAAYSLYNPSAAGGVGSVGNGGNMPLNNNMAGGFGSAANNRQLGAVPGSGSHTGQPNHQGGGGGGHHNSHHAQLGSHSRSSGTGGGGGNYSDSAPSGSNRLDMPSLSLNPNSGNIGRTSSGAPAGGGGGSSSIGASTRSYGLSPMPAVSAAPALPAGLELDMRALTINAGGAPGSDHTVSRQPSVPPPDATAAAVPRDPSPAPSPPQGQ